MANLKGLRSFQNFDATGFLADKKLLLMSAEPWKDYQSGSILGAKVKTIIWIDSTKYNKPDITNEGSELEIKVPNTSPNQFESIKRKFVQLDNPVGVIYGQYQNQLSLKADSIDVIDEEAEEWRDE
jgi:hypothetical protein